jgi:hypothetical protein
MMMIFSERLEPLLILLQSCDLISARSHIVIFWHINCGDNHGIWCSSNWFILGIELLTNVNADVIDPCSALIMQ